MTQKFKNSRIDIYILLIFILLFGSLSTLAILNGISTIYWEGKATYLHREHIKTFSVVDIQTHEVIVHDQPYLDKTLAQLLEAYDERLSVRGMVLFFEISSRFTLFILVPLFFIFIRQLSSNLKALGNENQIYSPKSSATYWFIPFRALSEPSELLKEIWTKSITPTEVKNIHFPNSLFNFFHYSYVASLITQIISWPFLIFFIVPFKFRRDFLDYYILNYDPSGFVLYLRVFIHTLFIAITIVTIFAVISLFLIFRRIAINQIIAYREVKYPL